MMKLTLKSRVGTVRCVVIGALLGGLGIYQMIAVQSVGAQPAGDESEAKTCPRLQTDEEADEDGDSNGEAVSLDDWQAAFFDVEFGDGDGEMPPPPPRRDELLAQQLDLTDEQKAQIESICEKERAAMEAMRKQTHDAIAALLTDEQRIEFEKLPPGPPPPPDGHRPPPPQDETEE